MNPDERCELLVALDEELLDGGVILSEWCSFIVREADIAFVNGAHLASVLTAVSGIETYLRSEYSRTGKERLVDLINEASLDSSLKDDLQKLRKYRDARQKRVEREQQCPLLAESCPHDVSACDDVVRFDLRRLYIDESGTADDNAEVVVVVGVLITCTLARARSRVARISAALPSHLPPDFYFHAVDVRNMQKFDREWGTQERLGLIRAMASVPDGLNLPISVGFVRREHEWNSAIYKSRAQSHHALAFGLCVAGIDKYMGQRLHPADRFRVVAEAVPKPASLVEIVERLKKDPITFDVNGLSSFALDGSLLGTEVVSKEYQITKLVGSVDFLPKREDVLLQIADAVAWSVRRYIAKQSDGSSLFASIAPAYAASTPLPKLDRMACGHFVAAMVPNNIQYEVLGHWPVHSLLF